MVSQTEQMAELLVCAYLREIKEPEGYETDDVPADWIDKRFSKLLAPDGAIGDSAWDSFVTGLDLGIAMGFAAGTLTPVAARESIESILGTHYDRCESYIRDAKRLADRKAGAA